MSMFLYQLVLNLALFLGTSSEPWDDFHLLDIHKENVIGSPIEDVSHFKCFSTCKETDGCKGTSFFTRARADGNYGGCYLLKKAKDGRRRDKYGSQHFTSLRQGIPPSEVLPPNKPPEEKKEKKSKEESTTDSPSVTTGSSQDTTVIPATEAQESATDSTSVTTSSSQDTTVIPATEAQGSATESPSVTTSSSKDNMIAETTAAQGSATESPSVTTSSSTDNRIAETTAAQGCVFKTGNGVARYVIRIGDQTGIACAEACLANTKYVDLFNGATVNADKKPGCFCKMGMYKINKDKSYQSCFIRTTATDEKRTIDCKRTKRYRYMGTEYASKQIDASYDCFAFCLQNNLCVTWMYIYLQKERWCQLFDNIPTRKISTMSKTPSVGKKEDCFVKDN